MLIKDPVYLLAATSIHHSLDSNVAFSILITSVENIDLSLECSIFDIAKYASIMLIMDHCKIVGFFFE